MIELDFNDFSNVTKQGLFVVAFGANWCRDCKFANPILEKLSLKYTNINFYHIDVDKYEEAREKMQIRHIPTILFIKDGEEICARLVEPNSADKIEEFVKKL